jgi:hypothetical protein
MALERAVPETEMAMTVIRVTYERADHGRSDGNHEEHGPTPLKEQCEPGCHREHLLP